MDRHGMDNQDVKQLNDFAKESLRSFLIGFVFLRDDPFFPIIIWPGETIVSMIKAFDNKTICDIGAIYLFKKNPEDIKNLYDAYCDSKIDNLAIWDNFRYLADLTEPEIQNYGMPFINFYATDKNGRFVEFDSEEIICKDNHDLEKFWGNEPDKNDFLF